VSLRGGTVLGVGGGLVPPTPDKVVHVRMPFFPRGVDVKRPQVKHWSHAIGGRGCLAGPPPIDWDAHARYHPPT
jgi:hypothetical protein